MRMYFHIKLPNTAITLHHPCRFSRLSLIPATSCSTKKAFRLICGKQKLPGYVYSSQISINNMKDRHKKFFFNYFIAVLGNFL